MSQSASEPVCQFASLPDRQTGRMADYLIGQLTTGKTNVL